MTVILLFALNAALSFALSLVLATLLGPADFGRYALALSIASVINIGLFEWLRLSTQRFDTVSTAANVSTAAGISTSTVIPTTARMPSVRPTLRRAYRYASLALAAMTLLVLALVFVTGRAGEVPVSLVLATALVGLALGWFDRGTAIARARFLDTPYLVLVGVRGAAAFAFAGAVAATTSDPAATLVATAAATLLGLVLVRRSLADPTARPSTDGPRSGALLRQFARYAAPLVAAGAIYQLMPLVNRAMLVSRAGFAEAGYFSLAGEIGLRLFQNLGAALDLALFQLAVRAEATHGLAVAERQVARNLAVMTAVIMPAAAGLVAVLPSFAALFVPADFAGRVTPAMEWLVPAFACFALAQYGLSPVFQLRGRTAPAIVAAAVGLVLDAGLLTAMPAPVQSRAVAAVQLGAVSAALAILLGWAVWERVVLPWRDGIVAMLATAIMLAMVWPLRALPPSAVTLALQAGLGAVVYGTLALGLDLAGFRSSIRRYWIKRGRAQPK